MSKGGKANMEATVEQMENIGDMATRKKNLPKKTGAKPKTKAAKPKILSRWAKSKKTKRK